MRIRSLKPEFWTDEVTGLMGAEAGLFFVGLWSFADDDGRFRWDPVLIRATLDPYDAKFGGIDGITRLLEGLDTLGRVVRYQAEDRIYGVIPSFTDHQKPNRKTKSKIPSPPRGLKGRTPRTQDLLTEGSLNPQGALTPGEEGRGEERKGGDARDPSPSAGEQPAAESGAGVTSFGGRPAGAPAPRGERPGRTGVAAPEFELLEHWRRVVWPRLSSAECPEPDGNQVTRLRALCKSPGLPAMKAAMDAAAADSWWGQPGKLDLSAFLSNVGKFIAMAAPGGDGKKPRERGATKRFLGLDEKTGKAIYAEDAA